MYSKTVSPWCLIGLTLLSWLTLPCSAKNRVNTERYIDGLENDSVRAILELEPAPWQNVEEGHLGQLLIPRPSGSANNTLVRNYMKGVFDKLGWHTEENSFTGATPIGDITFTNLIATFDIDAPSKLSLAAHFDSKHYDSFPANQFIGATDSAAPCATLLDVAEALTPLLQEKKRQIEAGDYDGDDEWAHTTLQIVLFDGEEAFHDWTATDSIYGARHLARSWETTYLPDSHRYHDSFLASRRYDPTPSVLSTIEHLVLLDLLGVANPQIMSFYQETRWLHQHLQDIEKRLLDVDFQGLPKKGNWFRGTGWAGAIDDDHRPFLEKGVSILHLIANPFPREWHTLGDNASILDMPTLRKWNAVMRVFATEYLGLPVPARKRASAAKRTDDLVSLRET